MTRAQRDNLAAVDAGIGPCEARRGSPGLRLKTVKEEKAQVPQQMFLVVNMKTGHYLDPRKLGDRPTMKGMLMGRHFGTPEAITLLCSRGAHQTEEDYIPHGMSDEEKATTSEPWFLENIAVCGDMDTKNIEMEGKEYKNLHSFLLEKGEDVSELVIKQFCKDDDIRNDLSRKCHETEDCNDDEAFMLRDIMKRHDLLIPKEDLGS